MYKSSLLPGPIASGRSEGATEKAVRFLPDVCIKISRLYNVHIVATQVKSRMATEYGRLNGSFHRVFACSAGGPGFDSRLRHNILRCSMERM
jgi:hypothetical protein